MTLRHRLGRDEISDEKNYKFKINKIHHGHELCNEKELGLFSKADELLRKGIDNFFIDTDKDVEKIVRIYRGILDGEKVDDNRLRKKYVLGWYFKGVE